MSSELSIASICTQAKKKIVMPGMESQAPRFELSFSYVGNKYSIFDFNMRRKAEILKYSSNSSSTKTNNLTKAQQWALMNNGNVRLPPSKSQQFSGLGIEDGKVVSCNGELIKTPTTASNVPSTPNVKTLYYDGNVPVYLFGNQTRSFAVKNPPEVQNALSILALSDVILPNDTMSLFGSLGLTTAIKNRPNDYFVVTVPLSIQITGTTSGKVSNQLITILLQSVTTDVLFNNQLVGPMSQYYYFFDNQNVTFNVSTTATDTAFSITQYIGTVVTTNIYLYTQPNYIYDLQTKIYFYKNQSTAVNISNVSIILNPSSINQNVAHNCSLVTSLNNAGTIATMTITTQ